MQVRAEVDGTDPWLLVRQHVDQLVQDVDRLLYILLYKVDHAGSEVLLECFDVDIVQAHALHVEDALDGEGAARQVALVGAALDVDLLILSHVFDEEQVVHDGILEPHIHQHLRVDI
jgi:hypothetical protein